MSRDSGRELAAALTRFAPRGRIVAARSRPWMCATFDGARHMVTLALPAGAAADFAATLPEAELALRGHFVAEATVVACEIAGAEAIVAVEALTVAESAGGNEAGEALVAAA